MPIISSFYGIKIRMYFMDNKQHKTPHIHVAHGEYIGIFDLNGKLIEGFLPENKKKLTEAWIEIHQNELYRLWNLLVEGKKGFEIEPLK